MVQEKIEAMGRKFLGIRTDLTSIANVSHIVQKAVDNYDHLDILLNNASILRLFLRNKITFESNG